MQINFQILHKNGWQSWACGDRVYFTFEEVTLHCNPENRTWKLEGCQGSITMWLDLLKCYKSLTGKDFVPGHPIQENQTYLKRA
jgi:hypothetical protein